MKTTFNYRYMLKRALPVVAFIGAGLMTGCKPEPTTEPEPIDPVKVLKFGSYMGIDAISYDNVMKYANDPRIEKIIYFLDSTNNNSFTGLFSTDIPGMRNSLQERLDYTPKATGAGTFIFRHGVASVEDSLWFVQNGWKIRTR